MSAEDSYDLFDYYEQVMYNSRDEKKMNKIKHINSRTNKLPEKYHRNRFYIGSDSVFNGRNWGHKTLPEAIAHAEKLITGRDPYGNDAKEEVFIVQIVRVVRKKKIPIEIEVIK